MTHPLRYAGALLLVALATGLAHGHGFTLGLSGNQLTVNSGGATPDLFVHDMNTIIANDTYSATHGLFSKQTSPSNPFAAGDTFRFDIVTPLYYSNGGPAAAAASNAVMDANHTQAPNQNIDFDGNSVGTTPGFQVSATSSHHMQWVLSQLTASDLGAYGFAYEISGYKDGNLLDPYDPVTGYVVFDTPGALYSTSLSQAQQEIYDALQNLEEPPTSSAIPEPASLAAAALGLAMLLPAARRRMQRNG